NWCLRAEKATRCARSPSPYSSTALSCALIQVRCAFFGDLRRVSGSSLAPGTVLTFRWLGCSRREDRLEDAVVLDLEAAVGLRGLLQSDVIGREVLDPQDVFLVQQRKDLRHPLADVGLPHP